MIRSRFRYYCCRCGGGGGDGDAAAGGVVVLVVVVVVVVLLLLSGVGVQHYNRRGGDIQLVEHRTRNRKVAGAISNRRGGRIFLLRNELFWC